MQEIVFLGQNRKLIKHVINFGYMAISYLVIFIVGGYYLDVTFFHNQISIIIGIILGMGCVILSFIRLVMICNDTKED